MRREKILLLFLCLLLVGLSVSCVTVVKPPPRPKTRPVRVWVPGHWEGAVWAEGYFEPAPPRPLRP